MPFSTLVTVAQLVDEYAGGNTLVFDCRFDLGDTGRGRAAYAAGHIPGARYAHLDDDLAGPIGPGTGRHPLPDAGRFIDWLRAQGLTNRHQVVIYDDGAGAIASRLWWMLRHWLGHQATAVLDGGWEAWTEADQPTESATPDVTVGDFQATPDASRTVDTAGVAALMEAGDSCLLDARMPPRFRGEMEPLDPAAGHIPGARNLPFTMNLGDLGGFADAQTLRAIYTDALAGHGPEDAMCMCGSGVTACHDLLAMDIAGLPGARLYVGSWSAWCSDPARPVATGD